MGDFKKARFLISQPLTQYSDKRAKQLCELRESIESHLQKFSPKRIQTLDFLQQVFCLTSPDTMTSEAPALQVDESAPLNQQVSGDNYLLSHDEKGLSIQFEKTNGERVNSRVVTLNVIQWPKQFALWQSPDNFCALLDSSEFIPCPFSITMCFRVMSQEKAKAQATQRYLSVSKQAASPMARLIPSLADVAADWDKLRRELDDNSVNVVRAYYGVTLYTTEKKAKDHQNSACSVFQKNGFKLKNYRYLQLQSFFATLPFLMSEGLYEDLSYFGRLKKLTSFNAANLLPLIGDWKGQPFGMTLTTARHQRFCFDPFQAKTDNSNILITGTSGSGKSFLTQRMIFSILAQGGWVFVIDVGGSYKKLCQLLGGVYLEGKDLSLNPFTYVKDIKAHADSIANLLAAMASPRDGLSDFQRSALTKAIEQAFAHKQQATKIDDVVQALNQQFDASDNQGRKDARIHDIAELLVRYCVNGTHGKLFNQPSQLSPDAPFVVLDLEDFKNNKDFMQCVLMSIMMMISERAYQSDRNQPKACFIDEAWAMLLGDNEDVKRFIEDGYRTIRKYGGLFCTISQEIGTFFSNRVAKAVYSSTAIKITLRQDLTHFCQEHPGHFSESEERIISRFEAVENTGYSSMLLDMGGHKAVVRLFADPFSKILFTTEPKQFAAVENAIKRGMPLAQAVKTVAYQYYPEEMEALSANTSEKQGVTP